MPKEHDEAGLSFEYEEPNMDIPEPPADLSYRDLEDFRQLEIVKANGIELTTAGLLAALRECKHLLLHAVIHTAGALEVQRAREELLGLLAADDEVARVESAHALIRLGTSEGRVALSELLSADVGIGLAPPLAAGYLARVGDPSGFSVVVALSTSELSVMRMLACKQLFHFVPLDGAPFGEGDVVAVRGLFERALRDPEPDIQWMALVQLREIRSEWRAEILAQYVKYGEDESLRSVARRLLDG